MNNIKLKILYLNRYKNIKLPAIGKKVLYGSAWAFSGKIVGVIAGLLINALLARMISPEQLGIYYLLSSLVAAATVIGTLGLNQTVVQLIARSIGEGMPGNARATVNVSYRLAGVGAVIVSSSLIFGIGQWLSISIFKSILMASMIDLAAIWIIVTVFQNITSESFRGFHDILSATFFGGVIGSIFAAIFYLVSWKYLGHVDLRKVLILAIGSDAISGLIGYVLLRKKVSKIDGNSNINSVRVLNMATPQLVTNITLFILAQASIWILGSMRPQSEVAIYGSVTRLVNLVAMPLLLVNAVIPPIIAELYVQGRTQELEKVLRKSTTLAGIPALIVLIILIIFGSPILGMVYGDYYRQGAIIMSIIGLGQVVNVWVGSCGFTLMMTGNQKTMMVITVITGTLTILLSFLLVRSHGYLGVALAASIGLIIQNISMWLGAKLRTGIWTHVDILGALQFMKVR